MGRAWSMEEVADGSVTEEARRQNAVCRPSVDGMVTTVPTPCFCDVNVCIQQMPSESVWVSKKESTAATAPFHLVYYRVKCTLLAPTNHQPM